MSGTLREKPPGSGKWEMRVYVGRDPATRKPVQVSQTFKGGAREARKALAAFAAEVHAGKHVGTKATFGKLLDDWHDTSRSVCHCGELDRWSTDLG